MTQHSQNSDVTVVLTSCERQDLLEQTLDSFLKFNGYPIREYFITEDSGVPHINDRLKQKYSHLPITWIEVPQKRGQLACIDDAYSRVRTPYIFHCEDDWEFYAPYFIEKSKVILENCPGAHQVWLRAEVDRNGHPLEADTYTLSNGQLTIAFRRLSLNYVNKWGAWHGFSFNPGLRRLCDYQSIGDYARYRNESTISEAYKARLLSAVILCGSGHVRHIGWQRHIYDPMQNR